MSGANSAVRAGAAVPERPRRDAGIKRALTLAAVLLAVTLAGCAQAPDVPDDAVEARNVHLQGLVLSAWVEERNNITYLRAVAENTGEDLETKEDCGYMWQSEVTRDNESIVYRNPWLEETCDWWHHTMRAGEFREFWHSWDGKTWETEDPKPAEPGNYTWTIRFLLRDGTVSHDDQTPVENRYLEASVDFTRA